MIKNYRFYLFDDVPLIIENQGGAEHTIYPDMYTNDIDGLMIGYMNYLNDIPKDKDVCVITSLWNTGKCSIVERYGSYIKVKN